MGNPLAVKGLKVDQGSYMIFPYIAVLFKQKWIYLNPGLYEKPNEDNAAKSKAKIWFYQTS